MTAVPADVGGRTMRSECLRDGVGRAAWAQHTRRVRVVVMVVEVVAVIEVDMLLTLRLYARGGGDYSFA